MNFAMQTIRLWWDFEWHQPCRTAGFGAQLQGLCDERLLRFFHGDTHSNA